MWSGWVDSAKAMAADVDRKLNEAVALDDNGNSIVAQSKTPEIPSTPGATKATSATKDTSFGASADPSTGNAIKIIDDGGDDDDAWNDDFDFDDDDVGDAKPLEIFTPSKPIQAAEETSSVSQTTTPLPGNSSKKDAPPPATTKATTIPPPSTPTATKIPGSVQAIKPTAKTIQKPKPAPTPTSPISTRVAAAPLAPASAKESPKPSSKPDASHRPESDAVAASTAASTAVTSKDTTIPTASSGSGIGGGLLSMVAQTVSTATIPSNDKDDQTTSTPANIPSSTALDFPAIATTAVKDPITSSSSQNEKNDNVGWDEDDELNIGIQDEANATKPKVVADDADHRNSPPKNPGTKEVASVLPFVPAVVASVATPVASVTTPVSGSGGLFSNFSNLAKTADSFLTPIAKIKGDVEEHGNKVTIATNKDEAANDVSASADQTPEAKDESATNATPKIMSPAPNKPPLTIPKSKPASFLKATPKPKATGPTPKFSPGGSLFSNLTNLAQTADSMLTAAVEQSAGVVGESETIESSDRIDSGGWDEDNVDDFFDEDDENDAEQNKIEEPTTNATNFPSPALASQEKAKTEESSSSFVKVSPTSSISTAEVVPQNDSILLQQQQQNEESENESPGQTSSPSPDKTKAAEAPPSKASASSLATTTTNIEDDPRFQQLQETLRQREEQLIDRGTQLNELQLLLESRDEQYKKKLSDTKEEAKKRITRAKERCEVAEAKLSARSSGDSGDLQKKQSIIDELMQEGQALAKKQSVMERAVRDANAETRALSEEIQDESHKKEQALHKIRELETQCKSLKDSLSSARKGESQAGKLENDLLSARADSEEKASTILILQQRLKEFASESKDLQREVNETRKSAAHNAQQEQTSMRREHNDLVGDLEQKLRTTEREAGVREDALRHEITEVRKRWQDSVRRADALSMDIQSSTAPLLRQVESMERQSRLRSTNSAELESRLRSDLEEATIENERMGKEFSEFKFKLSRQERIIHDRDQELSTAQSTLAEQARDIENLRIQEEKLKAEAETRQAEYETVERLANEGVARVRSEMSQTVTDSEERYRGQIDKLQNDLGVEKEKRSQLEAQVGQLLEGGGGLFATNHASSSSSSSNNMIAPDTLGIKRETTPKKLHKAENQAEILAGALGLGDDSSDDGDSYDSDNDNDDDADDEINGKGSQHSSSGGGGYHSFAAIEQLSSKLKTSEVQLKSMRKSLEASNEINQSLVEELGEARTAKEKLPLFEAKVKELTKENREMEQEISGLKEDVADVRELYRTQLNVLLEEKTALMASGTTQSESQTEPTPEKPTQSDGDDDW